LIPPPLQRQTIIRLGIGAVSLILLFPLAIIARNTYLWLPCAAAAVFFTIGALILYKISVSGDYVVLSGICQEAGFTAVKKRMKYIVLQAEGHRVQVALNGRFKAIPAGTPVILYISKNTPVYERDGTHFLYSYLAIDLRVKRQIIKNKIIDERCQK